MKSKVGMMAALAALVASSGKDAVNPFDYVPPVSMPYVTLSSHPADYGLYKASTKTHKQYLRSNHLGKFRKKK